MRIDPDTLYTPAEVASLLRCGKTTVYDLLGGGDIAVIKIGVKRSGLRVRGADLLAFLDSRREGGPAYRPNLRDILR